MKTRVVTFSLSLALTLLAWPVLGRAATPPLVLGPEIAVDQPAANATESNPSAAFNGTSYFVAWFLGSAQMGTRLDSIGTVLDSSPLSVGPIGNRSTVASTANGSLVVTFNDAGSIVTYSGRLITAGGSLGPSVGITTGFGTQGMIGGAAAGAIGSNYLAFWVKTPDMTTNIRYVIQATRVGGDGTTVTSAQVTHGGPDIQPATSCTAAACLMAFVEGPKGPSPLFFGPGNIMGVIVSDSLQTSSLITIASSADYPGGVPSPGFQGAKPQVAFDGTNWLVIWEELGASSVRIRAVRINRAGARVDAAPFDVGSYQVASVGNTALSFDGAEFVAAWDQGTSGVRLARISSAGVVLDPGGVAVPGPAGSTPSLAGRLLAYSRPVGAAGQVFVRLISVPATTDGGTDAAPSADAGAGDASSNPPPVDAATDARSADAAARDASSNPPAVDAATDVCSADAAARDASSNPPPVDAATDVRLPSDASTDRGVTDASPTRDAGEDMPAHSDAGTGVLPDHPVVDGSLDSRSGADGGSSGGGGSAGHDAGSTPGSPSSGGCGCATAQSPSSEPGSLALIVVAAGFLVANRRRRDPR